MGVVNRYPIANQERRIAPGKAADEVPLTVLEPLRALVKLHAWLQVLGLRADKNLQHLDRHIGRGLLVKKAPSGVHHHEPLGREFYTLALESSCTMIPRHI